MATVIVPFRAGGKSRLPADIRVGVALAMLGDVLDAATAYGTTRLVTDDEAGAALAHELGVEVVPDPGGGQGPAVVAALAGVEGPCIIVNADVPRARPSDLSALAVPARAGAVGIVAAADGTTNALGLPAADAFAPLYGAGSAARFRDHAEALGIVCHQLALSNLGEDIDSLADLERFGHRAGPRTRALAFLVAS